MRVVLQRVSKASVSVEGKLVSSIKNGFLILLGIEHNDAQADIEWLCGKISRLRVFEDTQGDMNLSINQVQGSVIVVSQFTLHASTKKGNRPSYIKAARPAFAEPLYEQFVQTLKKQVASDVKKGVFGAMMDVSLVNEGPVTILIDSKKKE